MLKILMPVPLKPSKKKTSLPSGNGYFRITGYQRDQRVMREKVLFMVMEKTGSIETK